MIQGNIFSSLCSIVGRIYWHILFGWNEHNRYKTLLLTFFVLLKLLYPPLVKLLFMGYCLLCHRGGPYDPRWPHPLDHNWSTTVMLLIFTIIFYSLNLKDDYSSLALKRYGGGQCRDCMVARCPKEHRFLSFCSTIHPN